MAALLISQSAFSIDENDILAKGSIKGSVFDSTANQPLEYATISLLKADNNKVVTGTISDASGFFKISGVEFGKYNVEITFIGYFTKKIEGVEISPKNKSIDIGQVELKPATRTMEEVIVKADRPTLQYKIDKKVINVSQQHTSASGTAAELLENIPSVTTDIDGNVSLRGSTSFTVLIDGKPTVLEPSEALAQIPASQIENIEIITNPSAKFDPDGVAGIINIIMKKNKLQGFSGIFNLNGGTQNRYGGDFLVTLRKNKFNFYIGGDLNNQEFIGKTTSNKYTIKRDTVSNLDTISYLNSSGDFTRGRYSYGIRGGLDYNINAFNTISLGFRVGNRNGSGNSDLTYNSWNSPSTYNKSYLSKENSDRGGDFYTATLDYNHNFSKKGHTLVGQFIFEKSNSSDSDITKVIDNNVVSSGQKSEEDGPETEYRLKLDYTLPTGEKNRFEAGLQSRVELENTSNSMYEYNPATSTFDFQQLYSHKVDYATNIHSAYSTYSGEYNKLGYQVGLRGEYTYRFISLAGENKNFTLDRFDYYPTLHVSYTLPKDQQVMASYTRRISRSHGYNLEPFLTWEDAHNVRIGNPSLKPEFIDSYELSYQKNFGKNTISVDLYYRITNNKVERITSVYDAEEQIFLNSIDNIGKDYSFGSEIMFGLDLAKWWHVDLMGNLYDYKEKGDLLGESFDKNSFNWNSRLNNTFKIGKNTRVQLNGMYNSPTVTAQGRSEGFLMTSIAAKQDFMKNKVSLTLQVRDLLHTSGHEMTSEGTDFYSYRKFKPDGPVVSMTLTVRLNNYKPDRKRQQVENNMEEIDLEN